MHILIIVELCIHYSMYRYNNYHIKLIKLCTTLVPTPNMFLRPNGREIGQPVDLVCSVVLSSAVDPSAVELMWDFISNDNRVIVIPATVTTDDSIGSIYSTVIQFEYLMEGDEGNYACNLTIQDSVESNFLLELTGKCIYAAIYYNSKY